MTLLRRTSLYLSLLVVVAVGLRRLYLTRIHTHYTRRTTIASYRNQTITLFSALTRLVRALLNRETHGSVALVKSSSPAAFRRAAAQPSATKILSEAGCSLLGRH